MPNLRALSVLVLVLGTGCGAAAPRLRVLSSEPGSAPRPEVVVEPGEDVTVPKHPARIGAPGGSGSGSRSVIPAQSGNDTVGGLPAGMGGGSGPRG